MKRVLFLWNVLVVLAVIAIIASGFRLYSMHSDVQRYQRAAENTNFGTDQELDSLITYLEGNLQKRELFQFDIRNKPVLLSNVIFLNEELAATQQRNIIRVSAIVGGRTNQEPGNSPKQRSYVSVKTNTLNAREEPSLDAPIVTKLSRGDRLPVLNENEMWYQVLVKDDNAAWVYKDLVSDQFLATAEYSLVGENGAIALVQYKGENYRLGIGDTLAGGRVVALKPEAMVMEMHNRRMTFPVLGLSMTPDEAEKYRVD
ncbi:MAG: hypothetical protein MAGBODY4_01203 [Candidatus Marinimicrobia bacterium]|nr:hypothetical protein [Candidatus Neomarinimicrobiota bacterium]